MPTQTRKYTSSRRRTLKRRLPKIIGINYEAGKTIQHVRHLEACRAYANIQIAMDAPFQGRVANESVRMKKRSELQFKNYDESKLIQSLKRIFEYIQKTYPDTSLIIQIARGRSWESMYKDVIKPILDDLSLESSTIVHGYRRKNYWSPTTAEPFVYVNIGMFGVISNKDDVAVGEICNPVETRNILDYDKNFVLAPLSFTFRDSKNILLHFPEFKHLYLYGIADSMPFVTKDEYNESAAKKLLNL